MAFLELVKGLVDGVKGGYAATIMGTDGISLQDYIIEGSGCDIESVGVEYGKIISEINKASEVLDLGGVEEVVITSEGMKVLLRLVTPEYFMAIILSPTGNSGKARYLLKKASIAAKVELED
jgi:predicted regulator of Ras-like GTPase activity (Roadblock/LC7/MglB family)